MILFDVSVGAENRRFCVYCVYPWCSIIVSCREEETRGGGSSRSSTGDRKKTLRVGLLVRVVKILFYLKKIRKNLFLKEKLS